MFESIGLLLFLTLITLIFGIYFCYSRELNYWSRRGVPSPPERELFWGHLKAIIGRKYINVFQIREWSKKFPNYYGIKKGSRNTLVVSDPDLAHEILVKKFEYFHSHELQPLEENPDKNPERVNIFSSRGLRWKRLRTTSNPIFSVSNLKKVMPTMYDSIKHLMSHFSSVSNVPINIHPIFQEVTMDVISRIALGQKGSNLFKNPYINFAKEIFMSPIDGFHSTLPQIFPFLRTPLRFLVNNFKIGSRSSAHNLHENLFKEIIKRKNQRAAKKNSDSATVVENSIKASDGAAADVDFIDLFLDAEVPEQQNHEGETTGGKLDKRNLKVSKELSVMEIVGQCFIFLLAGYDTTANSLSFVCYELVKNPEILRKLLEEIDDFPKNELLNYEQINSMKYLDCVVKESLRLHPIAAQAVNRTCMETTKIGNDNNNLIIEKGTGISIDVLSINYSEKLWGDEPEKFNPDRWSDSSDRRHPASFLTFGGGPRICLGMRLALLEEKMILIQLLRNFILTKCDETEEKLTIRGSHVFYPESVTVKLVPRK